MERIQIYNTIDSEREYQDKKWGGESHDQQHRVADWLLFIEIQLNEAKQNLYTSGNEAGLNNIKKIAALCVACMEKYGSLKRTEEIPY